MFALQMHPLHPHPLTLRRHYFFNSAHGFVKPDIAEEREEKNRERERGRLVYHAPL